MLRHKLAQAKEAYEFEFEHLTKIYEKTVNDVKKLENDKL